MPRPPAHTRQPGPPFNAPAARRLRAALGMTPDHVAHGLRASYAQPHATPELVVAWERGALTPTHPELTALAGVLWCSPGELIGRPRTLREHRVARGFAPEDVARAVGHEFLAYTRMEESGQWRGTDRQSAALAGLLGLSLPDLVTVSGLEVKLADLLRTAARTRWQAYVRPVSRIVPLDRRLLEETLQELHHDYQGHMVATLSWGDGSAAGAASDAGRDFLDRIVDTFWTSVENRAAQGAV
ncbi:transcriptional regulator with XRE-family HTH domain [Streptomyces sp. 3330]|uniref:XRE family transcriptional regulator n=1 Tax=Streptomyces sp. 3330 TaxID=2817755 RepID=UPI0028617590|nr:XRE family transcriptional regulator [Streptomyces sp. 3330]MDR6976937.1 transcriptional regulator with XRE-family HTH domain [Streptomyces sp. 3330]